MIIFLTVIIAILNDTYDRVYLSKLGARVGDHCQKLSKITVFKWTREKPFQKLNSLALKTKSLWQVFYL